jgi:hypothetical protein
MYGKERPRKELFYNGHSVSQALEGFRRRVMA